MPELSLPTSFARPPRYPRTLVDPYRDHLRHRWAAEPDVALTRLLAEIRELGYTGSANLLVRHLNQRRAADDRAAPPPRRLVSSIMTRPADLPKHDREHLDELLAACPHLAVLTEHVRAFRPTAHRPPRQRAGGLDGRDRGR